MTDQATPRPWKIGKSLGKLAIVTDRSHIATVSLEHAQTPRASKIVNEANAELIVQAVNAYDKNQETIRELVEACKEVTDRYERLEILYAKTVNINYDYENGSIKRAKQALTKAGQQ